MQSARLLLASLVALLLCLGAGQGRAEGPQQQQEAGVHALASDKEVLLELEARVKKRNTFSSFYVSSIY